MFPHPELPFWSVLTSQKERSIGREQSELAKQRGCIKSPLNLICQVELVETDIDYQKVKIFRHPQYDIELDFLDSLNYLN